LLTSLVPHGKQIVFYSYTPGKPKKIYTVSAEGGSAQQLMPDDPKPQADPNWSPDGGKVAFAGDVDDSAISVLDLGNHQVSTLRGSQGFYSPRWSPVLSLLFISAQELNEESGQLFGSTP
jgi:Tol biopolymer transport system component